MILYEENLVIRCRAQTKHSTDLFSGRLLVHKNRVLLITYIFIDASGLVISDV